MENITNNWFLWFLGVIFAVGFIIELRIFNKWRPNINQNKDGGSLFVVLTAIFLGLTQLVILSYRSVSQQTYSFGFSSPISWLGLIVMIGGFGLRQWSIQTLKNFFTPMVCLQPNHVLIDRGPYGYIRHPSYLGLIMELFGLGLTLKNILAAVIILSLLIPAILYRIGIEEKTLIEKFGEVYLNYKKRTKKLLL